MAREPGERLGRYVLERRLATGGMGDAWLAKQEGMAGFAKSVVVKTMHPHLAREPAQVEQFVAEARVSARLNHTNVVHIFDVGEDAKGPFIAMEYVDGLTLLTATRRCWGLGHGIPIDVAVRVAAATALGLAHAHAAGIVHRDISPDNIIVGRDGSVKVLDFGIAKTRGSENTKTTSVKGKIPYMAPEQLDPRVELDGRCDLYALGVSLYWCLAGRRPFIADIDVHLMRAILEDAPPPLRTLNPACSPELEEVVMNLLEKDRNKREGDGQKVATRLLATIPPTQENPVAAFIEGLKSHDGAVPENMVITTGTVPGLPAVTVRRASLFLEQMSASAALSAELGDDDLDGGPVASQGAASASAPPTSRTVAEGVVRPPPASPASSRSRAMLAAAAGVAVLVVVAAVALTRGGDDVPERPADPTGPKRHLVVRDEHHEDTVAAPEVKPDDNALKPDEKPDEKPDANPDAKPDEKPDEKEDAKRDAKPDDKAASASRTVSLIAPHDVTWTTASGRALGRGTTKAKLGPGDTALVAVDGNRGGRSTMPVAARMDWYSLPRGTLEIYVKGTAERVKLGKEVLGRPPLRPISAVVGSYTVVVELKGGKSVKATAKVKPKETTVVTIDPATAK